MVLPASDMFPCPVAGEGDEIYREIAHAVSRDESIRQKEFLSMEKPKMTIKRESLQIEKHISIDPISLKESVGDVSSRNGMMTKKIANSHLVVPLAITATPTLTNEPPPLPLLPPSKTRFLSSSLPNSASSSPRFSSTMSKKRWKNQIQAQAPPLSINPLARQHSIALSRLAQLKAESHLRRSKSCGEGRSCTPSDDFDLWLTKANSIRHKHMRGHNSFFKTQSTIDDSHRSRRGDEEIDEKFKCGALCLFLPGFGKVKPVRPRKEEPDKMGHDVSRTVSLEKFECGSWTSSGIITEYEDYGGDSSNSNLYFDLPFELIRCSVNDANSPVRAAFVFDKDLKGVLKNGASSSRAAARKSHELSSRHVRFSTSSPTSYPTSPPSSCITPRLRKARDDFNAFLEAQSA
ncbi:unnamed protein product [Ilex paraguariensis]|uniref:Uncharacterized protein n=1 Tax=Ilex paraguariensis TaxID=185542 RepID=A0ABC8S5J0_9AQUA